MKNPFSRPVASRFGRAAATGLIVLGSVTCTDPGAEAANAPAKRSVTLSGAWALYPLAVRWAEVYQQKYPDVRVDVTAGGAGKGMTDTLAGMVDIGMVSRDVNPEELAKGAFPLAVAKDAVVPVVSEQNPVLAELRRKGVTREVFAGIWIRGDVTTWSQVSGEKLAAPVRVYTRSDACGAAETWAKYMGKKQEDLKGIGTYGDPGLAEAVRKDPLAIGYNNVNFAYDRKTGRPVAGLAIVPLDVNNSGLVESNEAVYATQTDLVAAIARGDFPSPPARDLYLVTAGVRVRQEVRSFLEWVLTEGQAYVQESGYIEIPADRIAAQLKTIRTGTKAP